MINDREIFKLLPPKILNYIDKTSDFNSIQEVRLRVNKPVIIQKNSGEAITEFKASREDINSVIQRVSGYSIYAFEEDIKQGFLTFKGGHRIGVCGECVIEDGRVKTIKNISSLNIRISKEFPGCADFLLPYISRDKRILNTIIISPPKCGKTTILRDLTRSISNGRVGLGIKVSLIDERSEIAGCSLGVSQLDVGLRTDVFDNCTKSEGVMMAIRSMSPEVIVCDEIGTSKDVDSIMMAYNCGVNLICSLHGDSIKDYTERVAFNSLISNNIFQVAVLLMNRQKPGEITEIYDLYRQRTLWRVKDA